MQIYTQTDDTFLEKMTSSIDHAISRIMWTLSSREINLDAFAVRMKMDIHFPHLEVFGADNGFDREHFGWRLDWYEESAANYLGQVEIALELMEQYEDFTGDAHRTDALVPFIVEAPSALPRDKNYRWMNWHRENKRTNIPEDILIEKMIIATQPTHTGAVFRRQGFAPTFGTKVFF